MDVNEALLAPTKLYSRSEVLDRPSPVPASAGIYGWYFDAPLGDVPVSTAHLWQGHRLLYVGIAPKRPALSGKRSTRTLRDRVLEHYNLNAAGSTLRLTLGCLMGLELRRIASKKHPGTAKRMTFGRQGEVHLNVWMAAHARVVWHACADAWTIEHELMKQLVLPLNLDANGHSPYHAQLTAMRANAKLRAHAIPRFRSEPLCRGVADVTCGLRLVGASCCWAASS